MTKVRKTGTVTLVSVSLCAALIAVCSWISIPTEVPFTLQVFGVFLALRLLGGKKGTLSVLVYILLGLAGVPVFSGFKTGFSALSGPTGGFIFGFIASGLLYMLFEKFTPEKRILRIVEMIACHFLCYALGVVWFCFVYASKNGMGVWAVLMTCVIPFIVPDVVKILFADILAKRISPHINA